MFLFKQVRRAFLLFACLIFFSQPLLYAHSERVIKVGYQPNSDLISGYNSIGRVGIGYDILNKIESESNLHFEFVRIDGDIFDALESGIVDVIGLFLKSPEREENFLYSKHPFNTIISSLAAKKSEDFFYDNPQSIDGKTVATYKGNPSNILFDEYLEKNNISVTYLIGELRDYLNLDADFYLTFSENRDISTHYSVLNLANDETYLLSNFENRNLMQQIDSAYEKMEIAEGFFFNELVEKYNRDSIQLSHRNLTQKEVEKLREKPLVVGYAENHEPFTYTDSNGNANGAAVELMNIFASKYAFEVEYVPYNAQSDQKSQTNFDIIISVLGDTKKILQDYVPTDSYYHIALMLNFPKDSLEETASPQDVFITPSTVGIAEYLYSDLDKYQIKYPHHTLVFYNSFVEMFDAYNRNEVDVAMYTSAGSTYVDAFLNSDDHYMIGSGTELEFRFAVEKSIAHDYVPIINTMLDTLTELEYSNIFNAHTAVYYPQKTTAGFLKEYLIYFVSYIALLCLIFISLSFRIQRQKKDAIIKAYQTDELTGLISMSYFNEQLKFRLSIAKPKEYELISFDVDFFRTINTYYSMEQGTTVIIELAKALSAAFNGTPVLFSRKTSEQFYILRKAGQGQPLEDIYYNYLLPAVKNVVGERYKMSMSFGTVIIDNCNEKISNLMAYTDYARLHGKPRHETTFVVFDTKLRESFNSKLNITYRMDRAIKDREFKVYYQPKIDFKTLEIVGAEALVRWLPPSGDIVYPNDFIEVFERNGFISTLDFYVLKEVSRFISETSKDLDVPIVSINLSAVTVMEPFLPVQLLSILSEYNLEARHVDLEITESILTVKENTFLTQVKDLKAEGFTVSIDDFGAGLSSLNRLSTIEADVLKLDKAFFEKKEISEKRRIVVDEIITLAKRLNMKIVAEGVETYKQALWLRELNCDVAQGYYFSKPITEEEFIECLRQKKRYLLEESDAEEIDEQEESADENDGFFFIG